jgi:hypothetical protein
MVRQRVKPVKTGHVDQEGKGAKTVADTQPVESITPIVVDAGRRTRKTIRRLKEGRGRLMEEVADVIEDIRLARGAGKEIVPIVIIYRERRRRSRLSLPLIPSPLDLLR